MADEPPVPDLPELPDGRLGEAPKAPTEAPAAQRDTGRTNRELWMEVTVVFMVTLFPSFSSFLLSWIWPISWPAPPYITVASLENSLERFSDTVPMCLLLLYVISRSGEPWSRFGLKHLRWRQDAFLLLATSFLYYWILKLSTLALIALLGKDTLGMGGANPGSIVEAPTRFVEYFAVVLSTLVTAFYEELLMRGYLIPRFERLLGSVGASLLVTSVVFAGWQVPGICAGMHFSYAFGFVRDTVMGLFFGGVFCLTRRLWPIVAAHAAYNLWLDFS